MRPGWILPSCTSRSIETRATSRLRVSPLLGLHGPLEHQAPQTALELALEAREEPALGLLPGEAGDLLERAELLGLARLELLVAAAERLLGLGEAPAALVELALPPVEGRVAVVQALLDARYLGSPGPHLGLGLVFDPQGRLFGLELRFAAFGLGGAVGVLDDRTRVRVGLRLAAAHSCLVREKA